MSGQQNFTRWPPNIPPIVKKDFLSDKKILPSVICDRQYTDSATYLENHDPAHGNLLGYIHNPDESFAEWAVKEGKNAYETNGWKDQSPEDRAVALNRIADLLESELEFFADLESCTFISIFIHFK